MININDFLNSLAIYMVAAAAAQTPSVALNYLTTPRGLWIHKIVWPDPNNTAIAGPADPVSVIRIYGGMPRGNDEQDRRAIQCMTTTAAQNEAGAMQQAQALYETLLDTTNTGDLARPIKNLVIPNYQYPGNATQNGHWKIVSVSPRQPPGKVGVDASSDRPIIVFNFDAGIVPVS